jgi:hypothetical protein
VIGLRQLITWKLDHRKYFGIVKHTILRYEGSTVVYSALGRVAGAHNGKIASASHFMTMAGGRVEEEADCQWFFSEFKLTTYKHWNGIMIIHVEYTRS